MSATAVGSGSELEGFALQASRVNRAQAGAEHLTEETTALVEDLARRFGAGGSAPAPADTHDEILFYRALTDAQSAVMRRDRRAVRIALQRLQDALAQLVANAPVRDGRDANDVAQWLTDVLSDVSQQRVADILGVTRRTLSRWSAEEAATRPADEDARRLRTVARTVNLLLRGLTAAGTVAWFELPNRELEGRTPTQELARADAAPRLERAAYALLGGDAS